MNGVDLRFRSLLLVLIGMSVSGSTCFLTDLSRYPCCGRGVEPCKQCPAPTPPVSPGIPERGECRPPLHQVTAFVEEGIDYESTVFRQHCGSYSLKSFPKYTVDRLAAKLSSQLKAPVNLFLDSVTPNYITPGHIADPTAPDWRTSNSPGPGWGFDQNAADYADIVVLSGHGDIATIGNLLPRREIILSRGGLFAGGSIGSVQFCNVVGVSSIERNGQVVEVWDMRLGAGAGAKASTVVWASSCTLNDNVWERTSILNRLGQEFGFERSPNLYEPDMLELWMADSLVLSNQEAWIIEGLKISAAKESISINSGPVALALGATKAEAEDLFLNASLSLNCRTGQKLDSSSSFSPVIRWRKALTPCVGNYQGSGLPFCGKPKYCESNPDGGFPEGVGRNGQPLVSVPVRPAQPNGNTMMRPQLTIPNPSDLQVAIAAADIASVMAPLPTQPFDPNKIEPFIAKNRAEGTWALNHIGNGVLVGYKSSRNQLRVVNRDVVDVITPGGAPLDIGAQDAYDRASEIASRLGMQLRGLSESQVGADKPTLNVVVDGNGVNGSEYRAFAYVFSMFRHVNGVPVIDIENTIAIHRSGQLYYSDITEAGPATMGPPGLEVPVNGSSVQVNYTSDEFLAHFNAQARGKFDGVYDEFNVAWAGFVYVVPKPGADYFEPAFVIEFTGRGANSVSRMYRWAYSVAEPSSEPFDLPYSLLGEVRSRR